MLFLSLYEGFESSLLYEHTIHSITIPFYPCESVFIRGWMLLTLCLTLCHAQMPDPPGQVAPGEKPKYEAYVFAHMMDGDYGRLYYSVSLDGLHWEMLNGGKRVFDEYHGHASICKGHDGRYYLVGNRGYDQPDINFWSSEDLITWKKYCD